MHTTRKTRTILVALLAVIGSATVSVAALADDARTSAPHSAPHAGHQLDGTWTTTVELTDAPPGVPTQFQALDTFDRGGGLVVSSSVPNPSQRGLAHGSWTYLGGRSYASSFVWFRFDATGQVIGTQRVTRTMKVSRQHDSFTATDLIEVIAPTGAVLATIHGTEAGRLLTTAQLATTS